MIKLAICFTNWGPYHLARLRALGESLRGRGCELLAYEVAGIERRYPWRVERDQEPFTADTFFADRDLESIPASACRGAIRSALDRDRPNAVAIVGYSRPESHEALRWAKRRRVPVVLLSESQRIDHRRYWWKEAIKRTRVEACRAAVVGGPAHRDYLVDLGMRRDRITYGYNAIDNAFFADRAEIARNDPNARERIPARPYFLAINRFVPEKNLERLVRAFARYRASVAEDRRWDLVLVGDGPNRAAIEAEAKKHEMDSFIHITGFLQVDERFELRAFASAFVHPSLMEPWGLVVNEAAACGTPLLVSERAGCARTLVPDPIGVSGARFDPTDEVDLAESLAWMAERSDSERARMGANAARIVADWGPDRFAQGVVEALEIARSVERSRRAAAAIASF
jgi:glycosyltransferase involved in cell wall biosynthesis